MIWAGDRGQHTLRILIAMRKVVGMLQGSCRGVALCQMPVQPKKSAKLTTDASI